MRLRRRNTLWLGVLAAIVGVAVLSGTASPLVSATLIGLWLVAAIASVIDLQPTRVIEQGRSQLTAMRMSSEAREAVERARRRGGGMAGGVTLLDIGTITSRSSEEGMVMNRTRSVSKDDDGVRPFITLHVQPEDADRMAVLRFEIIDQNGQQQYVHEMRTYLRDGEMNILADHHLPLAANDKIVSVGDWDLRAYINGNLAAVHTFTVAPSLRERFERFDRQGDEARAARLSDQPRAVPTEEEVPLTLEELLRSRNRGNRE